MYMSSSFFLKNPEASRHGFVRAIIPTTLILVLLIIVEGAVLAALSQRAGGLWSDHSPRSNIIDFVTIEGTTTGLCAFRNWGCQPTGGCKNEFQLIDLVTGRPATNHPGGFVNLNELGEFQNRFGSQLIKWLQGVHHPQRVLNSRFQDRVQTLVKPRMLYCEELDTIIEYDSSIIGWSVDILQQRWVATFDSDTLQCVTLSGSRLYCGFCSGRIEELDIATGKAVRVRIPHRRPVVRLVGSPCERYLAIVADDGSLSLRDNRTDQILWTQLAASVIFTPHFIADGQSIVTLLPSDRKRLSVLNTVTGQVQQELGTHSRAIGASSTSALGQAYSWGLDGKLIAWDLQNGTVRWEFNAAGSASWF